MLKSKYKIQNDNSALNTKIIKSQYNVDQLTKWQNSVIISRIMSKSKHVHTGLYFSHVHTGLYSFFTRTHWTVIMFHVYNYLDLDTIR